MKRFASLILLSLFVTAALLAEDGSTLPEKEKKPKVDLYGLTIHTMSVYNTDIDTYGSTTGIGFVRTFGSGGTVAWITRAGLAVPLFQHFGEGLYGFKNSEFRGEYTTWLDIDLGFGIAFNNEYKSGSGRVGLLADWLGTIGKNNITHNLGFGITYDSHWNSGFYTGLCLNWYPWVFKDSLLPDTRAIEFALIFGFKKKSGKQD